MDKPKQLWSKVPTFYRDLIERATKTFGQVFVLTLLGSWVDFAHLPSVAVWQKALAAGAAAGLSVFTSWLSSLKGDKDSASLVNDVRPARTFGNGAPAPVLGGDEAEANARG